MSIRVPCPACGGPLNQRIKVYGGGTYSMIHRQCGARIHFQRWGEGWIVEWVTHDLGDCPKFPDCECPCAYCNKYSEGWPRGKAAAR